MFLFGWLGWVLVLLLSEFCGDAVVVVVVVVVALFFSVLLLLGCYFLFLFFLSHIYPLR